MTKEDERTVMMTADPATLTEVKDWEFDKIFSGTNDDGNTQESIFYDTSLLITSAIDGFNVMSMMIAHFLSDICIVQANNQSK